jgi:hypothetical protein
MLLALSLGVLQMLMMTDATVRSAARDCRASDQAFKMKLLGYFLPKAKQAKRFKSGRD